MSSAAEEPTTLKGARNTAGHYLGVETRLGDLFDVEVGAV
tara:strand:+ start:130 stop:249 length:120 start_codon:yes stop_codon:yes gene_type:complete